MSDRFGINELMFSGEEKNRRLFFELTCLQDERMFPVVVYLFVKCTGLAGVCRNFAALSEILDTRQVLRMEFVFPLTSLSILSLKV